jgi:hypothetical protein
MIKVFSGLFQDQTSIYYIKELKSKELPVWYDVGIIDKHSTSVSHQVMTLEEIKAHDLKRIRIK